MMKRDCTQDDIKEAGVDEWEMRSGDVWAVVVKMRWESG